ncbi:histidine phosphatase family protein [Pseudoalteromonas luteoviolacea]|uniref:SixA phosphatase family protein n=1 Tax=Pseudoalteromonas luteoviolacea TaxID=43657 RepID=UPI001F17D71C|nr:histidine phosphatase family protein [Pseudoalteromonas luteoviolacea]MCF6438804.1 histidine phosphatase family protein [Pseudoalteromonas luteoviolacea]
MKTLRLVRHAKSSWKDPSIDDFDRPLKPKGIARANKLAATLGPLPDTQIVTSPAKRAIDTAKILHRGFAPKNDLLQCDALYTFDSEVLIQTIMQCHDCVNDIFIVAHNPAITAVANLLGAPNLNNVVTCGYVQLSLNAYSWEQATTAKMKYVRHLFLD